MQLDQAISMVQQQFIAEAQDAAPEGLRQAYDQAREKYPAMMRVAHHVWANELIRQNENQARQQASPGNSPGSSPGSSPRNPPDSPGK